jgi:hypothetical protein
VPEADSTEKSVIAVLPARALMPVSSALLMNSDDSELP